MYQSRGYFARHSPLRCGCFLQWNAAWQEKNSLMKHCVDCSS